MKATRTFESFNLHRRDFLAFWGQVVRQNRHEQDRSRPMKSGQSCDQQFDEESTQDSATASRCGQRWARCRRVFTIVFCFRFELFVFQFCDIFVIKSADFLRHVCSVESTAEKCNVGSRHVFVHCDRDHTSGGCMHNVPCYAGEKRTTCQSNLIFEKRKFVHC